MLQRAQKTLGAILEQVDLFFKKKIHFFNQIVPNVLHQIGQTDLPVSKTWRLNERHYGGLTGLNKAETAEKHGEEQVQIWYKQNS